MLHVRKKIIINQESHAEGTRDLDVSMDDGESDNFWRKKYKGMKPVDLLTEYLLMNEEKWKREFHPNAMMM